MIVVWIIPASLKNLLDIVGPVGIALLNVTPGLLIAIIFLRHQMSNPVFQRSMQKDRKQVRPTLQHKIGPVAHNNYPFPFTTGLGLVSDALDNLRGRLVIADFFAGTRTETGSRRKFQRISTPN